MISTQDGPHKIYIKIGFTLLNSRAANEPSEAAGVSPNSRDHVWLTPITTIIPVERPINVKPF